MNRITPQDKLSIRHFHNAGWSNERIAQKFGKSKQTIAYHLGRIKLKTYDGMGKNPLEIPEFIRKNLEKVEKPNIKKGRCVICGGKKDKKFKLANVCRKCFNNRYA